MIPCCQFFLGGNFIDDYLTCASFCMCVGLLPWACCSSQVYRRRVMVHQLLQGVSLVAITVLSHIVYSVLQYSIRKDSPGNVFLVNALTPECLQRKVHWQTRLATCVMVRQSGQYLFRLCDDVVCRIHPQELARHRTIRCEYSFFQALV